MCGILVLKANHLTEEIKTKYKYALDDLQNRGPDEIKMVQNGNLLVGFTRLSINDIKYGSQPFKSKCGRYLIVFNGEIVNYKDLASRLREKNIKMKSGCEAEVIIELFVLYGKKCVDFLRGFFAFVIIEIESNNIFAAVDRFSIKPLYYFQDKKINLTIITSDYSTLIKNNLIKKELNFSKIFDFFSLARDFDNSTIFNDVIKLEPSTIFTLQKNQINTFKYWHPFKNTINVGNYKNASNLIENKLNEITNLWKVADTKISLCLSTGVDSQILSHFNHKNKISLTRFYIEESKKRFFMFNETLKFKLDLKKTLFLLNKFTKNIYNPFPLVHASSMSLLQLYDEIKSRQFKFTIVGEGADELLGGYKRYNRQLNYIKNKKLSFNKMISKIYQHDIENVKNNFKKNITENYEKSLMDKIAKINFYSNKNENKILEFDQNSFIPVLMQRHDFIGMNFGLEVRPPFLDHEFVELVNSLPVSMKFNEYKNKILFTEILRKKFNYNTNNIKMGTPNVFEKLMGNKDEINNFKEGVFYGEIAKLLNIKKVIKKIKKKYKNKDAIFLWRLYVLNKILYQF